ncbi:hypothetical protein [Bradyrhizobium canariense]|uniref:Uncharacterized protein n=1 Tax=Bradyrhizobium canariense TaxID=255045 RepID=A0A1H1UYN5_9BRAD|nr:hypothetical protein [Bradyrhizobium canariense]SDS77563.1 hypothetical protein SAMN05444158_3162 [Bradyrhizobium canariense]
MRRFRNRDFVAIIFALLVAGALTGWAASVAVNYFERVDPDAGDRSSPAQQHTVDPE